MVLKPFTYLLVIFALLAPDSFAQIDKDTLFFYIDREQPGTVFTSFNKQLNTYNLNTKLSYVFANEHFYLDINEFFQSTVVKSTDKNSKDDQRFRLLTGYSLNPNIDIGINAENNILSDTRSIQINSASVSSASLFGKVKVSDNIYVASSFGYSNNQQIGESDNGFVYGIEALLDNYLISNTYISSSMRYRNEDISPRKNLLRNINVSIRNVVNYRVQNHFTFRFNQLGRDFYYKADSLTSAAFGIENNLQRRTETSYFFADRFSYRDILKYTSLYVTGSVLTRTINRETQYKYLESNSPSIFDTKINELKFELESNLVYRTNDISANLKTLYSERDERHSAIEIEDINPIFFDERSESEQRKNNLSKRIMLAFSGHYLLTETDRLSLSITHSKLQYDTPSEGNFDDRDELLSIIRMRYLRKIHSFFDMFLNIEGNLNQTVYIFSERSSNNNTNRVLKFSTGGTYRNQTIFSHNRGEISANYTVYDFEDINPNYKSYSLRQVAFVDSTIIALNNHLDLELYGYLKITEQGDLNWTKFTMNPTRKVKEIYLHPQIIWKRNRMRFGVGLRYFTLHTFKLVSGEEEIDTEYNSLGPSTDIQYRIHDKVECLISGYYEMISGKNTLNRDLTTLNIRLHWMF